MRLNQYIAFTTGISRRQADEMIKKGLVELDGEIGQLHDRVGQSPHLRLYKKNQWVTVSSPNNKIQTILFYKPIFSLSSRKSEDGKKTIYDQLPKSYEKLKNAGRLDYMSEGLMVLSNDGDLIYKLTHPNNESSKEYLVGLKYQLKLEELKEMRNGVMIDDYMTQPADISLYSSADKLNKNLSYNFLHLEKHYWWYKFILQEGRNNQIRNMCALFGQKVLRLIRVRQGDYYVDKNLYTKKIVEVRK